MAGPEAKRSLYDAAMGEYETYYAIIRQVPAGRVVTYGDVAHYAGRRGAARRVGYALHALRDDRVPWWRVINARGEISPRRDGGDGDPRQRALLAAEGIVFDRHGRVDLARYRYAPPIDDFTNDSLAGGTE